MKRRPLIWAAGAVVVLALVAALILRPTHDGTARWPQSLLFGSPRPALAKPATAAAAHPDGEWHIPAGDYASTRFSTLDQINTSNAGQLRPAFTFDTGYKRGHEAAPLVVGTTMYLVTPFPNVVYALDLTKPDKPLKWRFDPHPNPKSQGVACCDVVNRGMSYNNGRLFMVTLDGQVISIDAATGKQVWRTPIADWAHGPDKDALIGPEFKPFYDSDKGKDLGVNTWPGEQWKHGGGTVWGWISYDPKTRTIFYGTSNPGPWNPDQRPGDNKWTAGIFARNVDTGQAKWYYQTAPHDLYDHDGINEMILLDLPVNGQTRKVLVHPGRTGYMYVIDRVTGQVLSADAYGPITAYLGVDLKTGRIRENAAKKPVPGRATRGICPAAPGAKDWNPSAFSPRTGLIYVPHINLCMDHAIAEANYIPGTPYLGTESKFYAGPGGYRGVMTAWDPVRRKKAWEIREDVPLWSGALATAGDVVFYGTLDGWFKAVDARTGKLLWQYKTQSGIVGQPITYRGPDGRQYVAIFDGVGGWVGALVSAGLDPGDPTGGLGMFNAVKDLPARTQRGGRLYVFALPR
jgi:glucose dehydrogenase